MALKNAYLHTVMYLWFTLSCTCDADHHIRMQACILCSAAAVYKRARTPYLHLTDGQMLV